MNTDTTNRHALAPYNPLKLIFDSFGKHPQLCVKWKGFSNTITLSVKYILKNDREQSLLYHLKIKTSKEINITLMLPVTVVLLKGFTTRLTENSIQVHKRKQNKGN